jgi:hypothetical protein
MPLIKTTRTARIALWALRVYLLVLLGLIGLKFVRMSTAPAEKGRTALEPAPAHAPKSVP